MKTKLLLLLVIVLSVSACGQTAAMPNEDLPTVAVTEEPELIATQTVLPPQPEQPVSTAWKAVHDPRYGFGLAIPCWWLVNPISADGNEGLQTIKNYDDAYFNAHSNKGFWDWPNGTLKLDIVVMEDIDPAKSDADAYMQFIDPTMTGLVSAESRQIGVNTVTVLTLSNLVNTNDPNSSLFVYRLTPSTLLMVIPIPQTIANSSDFQAILASIVLTSDEQVTLPTITPAPALINASCAQ